MTDQNRATAEVTLAELLNYHKREVSREINCHALGVIESFDSSTQTCKIKINYLKTQLVRQLSGVYAPESSSYPILLDCPTIIMSGGDSGMSFPIKKGDSCIVLFNDRDIDNWVEGVDDNEVASNRLHSISDGIALIGPRNKANKLTNYDPDNPHIWNGATGIRVKVDKVLIENTTDKLGLLMRELIDQIKAITTSNAIVGAPSTISPASQVLIETVALKIQGLLE